MVPTPAQRPDLGNEFGYLTDPDCQYSAILAGDPIEEIRALKEKPGRDIVVTGSIPLCHALIGTGLD